MGMPIWVKCLFFVWCILSIALLYAVGSINYSRNKQNAEREEIFNLELVKTNVSRLIEDFDATAKGIIETYPKESNKIVQDYNKKGTYESSGHIRKQNDMLNNFKTKDINLVQQMSAEANQIKNLYHKYENEKKKFEEKPRKIDLQMNKNNPIINENFEMTRY